MEPITTAIVAALTAGATAGMKDVTKKAITQAYDPLKKRLLALFEGDQAIANAVAQVEQEPESKDAHQTLQAALNQSPAIQDQQLEQLRTKLISTLNETQEGQASMAKFNIQAEKIGAVAARIDNLTQSF